MCSPRQPPLHTLHQLSIEENSERKPLLLYYSHGGGHCTLVSVGLLTFYIGGSKVVGFFARTEHIPRKLLYFVNRHNVRSSKLGPFSQNTIISLAWFQFSSDKIRRAKYLLSCTKNGVFFSAASCKKPPFLVQL